jgi:RNA-binding protein 26
MGMGSIPPAMLPFMSMMNNAMFPAMNGMEGGNAYDPNERMDMQRAPMMRRQDVPVPTSGELPVIQDLTPWAPPEERVPKQNPDQPPEQSNMVVDPPTSQDRPPPGQFGHHPYGQSQNSRGRRGRGGPRINGTFPSHSIPSDTFNAPPSDLQVQQPPRPDRRQDKTLVVEKIPEDRLALGSVNDWFKQFGTVTNIAVDPPTAKALVTFAEHDQAWKAWKSEEAVFGNRFVKVYWHRPLEGRGGRGVKALEVSAKLVGKLQGTEEHTADQPAANGDAGPVASSSSVSALPKKPVKAASNALQELTAKQERLQQMIAEQKALMSRLGTATAEEKKEIMAKLRKLGEDMKTPAPAPPVEKQEDVEMGDRETNKKDGGEGEGNEESTEELQAKLAKLKEEVIMSVIICLRPTLTVLAFQAASLGIPEAEQSYGTYGGYTRPWRGRGRGRGGHFRARGGPPRASMKLDNRPRKLLVKGVPEEAAEVAQNWYGVRVSCFPSAHNFGAEWEGFQTTNGVESVERLASGDLIVSFKSRNAAEQVRWRYAINPP